jgi:flagellar M-ring protein FliF
MRPAIESTVQQLNNFWHGQTKRGRILVSAGVIGVIVLSLAVTLMLNTQSYTVLYRGLSNAESAEVLSKLDGMGVDTKVRSDGAILVPKAEEARLKMQLASEGYPKSTLNYDIFTSSTDFMTTDYEKKKYLIFQLQNRLQDAIRTLQGVQDAIVTISVPDDNSFVLQADKNPSTASVILALDSATELSQKQVDGIEALVSKSVPGLESKNVVIIDGNGNMLNKAGSDDETQTAYGRMDVANAVGDAAKNKIISLLEPVFGKNGMSVAVNVVVDFEKILSEEKTYTPVIGEKGVVSREDLAKQTAGSQGAEGIPGTNSNTEVTTYPEAGTGGSASSSETSSTDYLVNQLIRSIQNEGGQVRDMSVAVLLDQSMLADGDTEKYQKIVAAGAGVDPDKVIITAVEFTNSKALQEMAQNALKKESTNWALVGGGGLAVVVVIAGMALMAAKKRRRKKAEAGAEAENGEFYLSAPGSPLRLGKDGKAELIPGEIVLNETREQGLKRQIKDFSAGNPKLWRSF